MPQPKFEKELEFRQVSFSYEKERELISNLNFKVKKGEMIGFAGGSGGGKSTLLDLLLGLQKPQGGDVLVDGVSLWQTNVLEWRRSIAYVSQEVFLFHDSVANNIRWTQENLNSDEIKEVAKWSHSDQFIENMSESYDSIIGERGVKLSGGQRQRLALARALARRPQILVLDEATSALDTESERYIQDALDAVKHSMTIFVVAHRLSTLKNCDRIFVFEKGKIVESGTWDELGTQEGRFHHLLTLQQKGAANEFSRATT